MSVIESPQIDRSLGASFSAFIDSRIYRLPPHANSIEEFMGEKFVHSFRKERGPLDGVVVANVACIQLQEYVTMEDATRIGDRMKMLSMAPVMSTPRALHFSTEMRGDAADMSGRYLFYKTQSARPLSEDIQVKAFRTAFEYIVRLPPSRVTHKMMATVLKDHPRTKQDFLVNVAAAVSRITASRHTSGVELSPYEHPSFDYPGLRIRPYGGREIRVYIP